MKLKLCAFWSVLTFVSATAINVSGEETQPYAVPGRFIVVLKHGHSPSEVANKHGLTTHHVFSHALNGFAADVPEERLDSLRRDPQVEYVESDLQMFIAAQTVPTGIRRIGTLLSSMAKIDGLDERVDVDIAILDTGVAPHPDLNIFTNVSFVAGQTTDGNGHGTHVAGIAAALDNASGVVGVAPGARLWAIKVLDDAGSGTTSQIIEGVDFITQNAGRIEVANMSLSGIGYSSSLRQAISNSVSKGVVFVVAAGNDSRDIYGPDGVPDTSDDSIPAAYPEVMAVSALSDLDGVASADDRLADFSNYSRYAVPGGLVNSPGAAIDLAAPGVNIYSTYLGGGYATMSGTSMSAPHVAGAVALYVAAHGRVTNSAGVYAVRQALIDLAQPQSAWGSANTLDPDLNHEGLVYVANIASPVNNSPVVVINAPVSGSSFAYNSTITFTGSANDAEDGNLGSALTWTSSINGLIGTGASFSRVLSPGTHTITASVTDSGGKTASSAVSITVLSPPLQTLYVSVVTDKSSYVNRNKVYITVTVAAGTNRAAGAAVHLDLTTADGGHVSSDTTSDANGIARFQYTINTKRDGVGTYSARVTASKAGYNPGSATTSFIATR
ncbi:MAG TPA: S8 family serine peptidase [Candidatus Angelobacter sp.]|nr:S8 family serine peptidase [Candidatus Angelobacter sp.]